MAREALYTEQTSLKLTRAMKERIDAIASEFRVSAGDVMRECIEDSIDDVEARFRARRTA